MRNTAAPTPSPKPSPSFARTLAGFAAPGKKIPPASDFDDLADDIATLSYEHALKTHARYRTAQPADPPADKPHPAPAIAPQAPPAPAATTRKSASITVRLTGEENDRLRARAAEAGMTVSTYLRSCAFEVETLRAQVKNTLAELKQASQPPTKKSLWARVSQWRRSPRAAGNAPS